MSKLNRLWDRTFVGELTHDEWLKRHAGEYTVEEIMAILNRSRPSVTNKLKREGLEAKGEETAPANEVCGIPIDSLLAEIKDKPRSLDELSHKFDRSKDTIRRAIEQLEAMSYEITQTEQQRHVWSTQIPKIVAPPTILWDKDVWEFALGVTSDWHDGSKGAQISARNRAIQIMYDYGVRDIIVPGDISAGRNVYRGQHLDVVSMEADDQVAITDAYCPKMDGLRYHMMGGNHDYSHIREGGYNALKDLCKKRDDFLYYGYDLVTMPLTEEVDALVWHPTGSQAYAMCVDEESQILTKRGWATVKDISLSDEVVTLNPKTGSLEYQHPRELFIQEYEGPMVHFKSRTVNHLVTPEHELWVRKYCLDGKTVSTKGEWQKVSAADLSNTRKQEWQMTMVANWEGKESETFKIPFKPWSGAKDLGDVPTDDFLEFLGWYVSEGHIEHGKAVCVTNTDRSAVHRICELMQNIGLRARIYEEERENYKTIYHVRGYSANLCRWLEEHCGAGSYNKKVPDFIKGLSPRQIGIFLDSLCDGDGWGHREKDSPRWKYYKSVSSQLLDGIQELALKVGQAATIHSYRKQTLTFLNQNQPTINKKPEIIQYKGLIWCVRVPNGLIYVRRDGKPIWTGNSYRSQKMVEQVAFEQLMEVIKKNITPKVRFLFVGHWHGILMGYCKGPIWIQHPGAFEGQTNLSKRMGVFPEIAGVILEGKITKDRNIIRELNMRPLRFTEIEDDYLNYPVPREEREIETLFKWEQDETD